MRIGRAAFDASTFSKNHRRLLDHDVADEFLAAVVRQAKLRRHMSSDHFSVDGTLLGVARERQTTRERSRAGFKITTAVYNTIRITALDDLAMS